MPFQIGDTVTISGVFRDTANVAVDPTGVVFKLVSPTGWSAQYVYGIDATVVKASAGYYYMTAYIPTASAGMGGWWAWWVGGTGLKAAAQGSFEVERSKFFP